MAVLKRILPFWMMPGSFGLKGQTLAIAEAEYYLTDLELETKLNEIKYTGDEYLDKQLRTDLKWNKISQYEFDITLAKRSGNQNEELRVNFEHGLLTEADYHIRIAENSGDKKEILLQRYKYDKLTEAEYAVALAELEGDATNLLEVKFKYGLISEKDHDYGIATLRNDPGTWLGVKHKHGEISDNEFLKEMATLRGEPHVYMKRIELHGTSTASFELDWNQKFIEDLRKDGFNGKTDEDCVDLWFTNMSKNVALAELAGTGVFDEQAEESYKLKKKRIGDTTEYK